jgi:transposase
MSEKAFFVGIDVAKDRLDVAVNPSGETKTFSHNHQGLSSLTAYVLPWPPL